MKAGLPIALGCLLTATSAATIAGQGGRSAQERISVDILVAKAGDYIAAFTEAFSNVVVEERYLQEVTGTQSTMGARAGRRTLRSDVVLLKIGGPLEWRPYRDVFDVDGKPVRDRDDRLMKLFQEPSATSFEQAARIAQESARFNIGLAGRTINTPLLSLLFLQRSIQPRFRFRLGRQDAGTGARVWTVEYREEARPTIIRGLLTADNNTDLPASGRFWIDADTGRVPKAELLFAAFGMRASLITTFRRDDRLSVDVPADMREVYRIERRITEQGPTDKAEGAPRVTQLTEETVITGMATYSNFRQFEVKADTAIVPAKP